MPTSRNDNSLTSSLRGQQADDAIHPSTVFTRERSDLKQSTHTTLTPSLRGFGTKPKQSILKNKFARSATESRSASWCIKREKKEAEVPPLFLCKKRELARLSPKSEKAELFSFGFRLTSAVGKVCRGAGRGCSPFCEKNAIL